MDSSSKPSLTEEEVSKLKSDRVSLRKAAALIGRSYPTTLKLVTEGKLAGIRIGSRWVISLYEVRRFLEQGNNVPSE